ncbi:hypothetical protein DQ04_02611070 [Trypanosoma grayi]|uniref:hypothetical protein n=1 Tax=Trypanosoma grayi TaxID=71804 RepID=UPI0004F49BA0|nr:hypothetical protein DQ04_02611070 [Trypanosoma grayi]KEG11448.1 hypothetical protein DQ04_02611070 [Trypanosoma grayi]
MTATSDDAVDKLLHENREMQAHVYAMIQTIELHITSTDALRLALKRPHVTKKETGTHELLRSDSDTIFQFRCNSHVHAAPLQTQPPQHCFALAPKFRWNQRATRSLKRQVDRVGLDAWEVKDPARWQVVADAVNYDSKATQSVDDFQCYQHYQQMVAASSDRYSVEEDHLITGNDYVRGQWDHIAADIFKRFGHRRTIFQVAQRYRKLKRELYECTRISDDEEDSGTVWKTIETVILANDDVYAASPGASPETEAIAECALQINAGRTMPWVTEDSIRKALVWRRVSHGDADTLMRQNIYAILLSGEDYSSSREAREVGMRVLHCDPLGMSEASNRARWRYTQITLEEAAERLASSLTDMKERILAKALRWYDVVYASDFFRLSMNLFGQRDGALACFLVSREYERRRRRALPHSRLNFL